MATQTVSSTPSSSKTNSITDADDNSDSDIISTARVESVTRPREISPAGVAAKQMTNSGLRTSTTKESVHQNRAAAVGAWNGSETNPQHTYYPHHPSQSGEETKREEKNSSANHQHQHHHRRHSQHSVLSEDEKHRDETNPSPHPHPHHRHHHHHHSHSPLRSARRGLSPSVVLSPGTIVRSALPEGSSLARTLTRDSTLLTASRPAFSASAAAQRNGDSSLDSDNDGNNSVTSHTTLGAEYLDSPETQVSRYNLQTADSEYLDCGDTKAAYYLQTANSEYLDSRGTKVSRYLQTVNSEENYCETEPQYDYGGFHLNKDQHNGETPITASPENAGTADLGLLRNFKTRGSTNLKPESGTGSERCADDRENYSSSSGKNSKQSEDNLQRRVEDSWINASPQFRRLESRRGSSVTFILPAHASTGDNSSQSSSRHQSICAEEAAQLQERFSDLYARRMSAPELPPIADRERHRPPSRSNSKSSLNQLTAAVNNKNFYTRLTSGATLHRNHSDSSLKGLLAASLGPTQSSGSVSSYPSGGGGGGGLGGGGSTPGPGDVPLLPPHLHRCSSRALSWCATDNSAGSIPKLETLFERKNAPGVLNGGGGGNTALAVPGTPPSKNHNKNNNNNNNLHAPNNNNNLIPPRSVSVSAIRRSDSQELAKIKGRKKRLQSESGAAEVETLATIEQFGRLSTNGMKRSVSDNKLVEKKNVRNARLNSSRHISVSRTDKLTSRKSIRHGTSTVSGAKGMRRVCSVSAINNVERRTRINSNQDTVNVDGLGGGSDDSEEEEERSYRIREWLLGLDCADAPPEPVIEYADDPPQTDTALHVVYRDES